MDAPSDVDQRLFVAVGEANLPGGIEDQQLAADDDVLDTIARGSPTPGVKPCDATRLGLDVLVTGCGRHCSRDGWTTQWPLTSRGLRTNILDKHDNDFDGEDALACAGHRC